MELALTNAESRVPFVEAVYKVTKRADVLVKPAASHTATMCVAAVFDDPDRRFTGLGGRVDMPRSLASIYAGSVARFLGSTFTATAQHFIKTPVMRSIGNGLALSHDGATLLVSDNCGGSHAIHEFRVSDGARLRVIGSRGVGPLQFRSPAWLCFAASDDFVFVPEMDNNRIQVLTPRLEFHSFVGVGQIYRPKCVCANDEIIAATEETRHSVVVFSRGDGALIRRFGNRGAGDGEMQWPGGLCLMASHRQLAVVSSWNHSISIFTFEGVFVRHVGVGTLYHPGGVACSAYNELVVADGTNRGVVFSASGEVHRTMRGCLVGSIALRGGVVVTQATVGSRCAVFM